MDMAQFTRVDYSLFDRGVESHLKLGSVDNPDRRDLLTVTPAKARPVLRYGAGVQMPPSTPDLAFRALTPG